MTPEPDRAATSHTDADLVAAAASGSESAFRALYRAYVRPVYWLAHSLVGTSADAEVPGRVAEAARAGTGRRLPAAVARDHLPLSEREPHPPAAARSGAHRGRRR